MVTDSEPYVIDASATVEYLLESELGLQVAALILDARLIAPELLDAEVLSALRQETLRGRISEAEAVTALERLNDLPVERVSHQPYIRDAWELRHNVSAYDALYVAVARIYGATLLTADGRLARAPGLPITLLYIRDG